MSPTMQERALGIMRQPLTPAEEAYMQVYYKGVRSIQVEVFRQALPRGWRYYQGRLCNWRAIKRLMRRKLRRDGCKLRGSVR